MKTVYFRPATNLEFGEYAPIKQFTDLLTTSF